MMLNNATPGHCGQCGGLMVLDPYDPDERVCSSCGRSTFKPDPAPYKARNWERQRSTPKPNPGLTASQLTSGIADGFAFAKPVRRSGRGGGR